MPSALATRCPAQQHSQKHALARRTTQQLQCMACWNSLCNFPELRVGLIKHTMIESLPNVVLRGLLPKLALNILQHCLQERTKDGHE